LNLEKQWPPGINWGLWLIKHRKRIFNSLKVVFESQEWEENGYF